MRWSLIAPPVCNVASVSDLRKCKRERRRVEDSRPRNTRGSTISLDQTQDSWCDRVGRLLASSGTISDVRFLMVVRGFAGEKESEGKRRRIEDRHLEIFAHPGLALGRRVAGKFRKPLGDEPRHLVLVPDA